MRPVTAAITMAVLLAAGPARAFDADGVDIIGLRLGMSEAAVIADLSRQGFTMHRTPESITANTKDAQLSVLVSAGQGLTEIKYVFFGRGAGAPAKIREAVMIRFGDPDQATPPAWCKAVVPDGMCPKAQASLTFWPDTLTLLLVSGQNEVR